MENNKPIVPKASGGHVWSPREEPRTVWNIIKPNLQVNTIGFIMTVQLTMGALGVLAIVAVNLLT